MWSSLQVRPGIRVGFTDATAGNLAFHVGDDPALVAGRRVAVEHALAHGTGASPVDVQLAYMEQVHGAEVAVLDGGSQEAAPTADAMVVTAGAGSAAGLAVMVADCVPVVLLGETQSGEAILAVAHAGRPGVEKGVIAAVAEQMRRSGAVSIEAWLGPGVCGRCYEVPETMRAVVAARVPESWSTTSLGTPALDLPAAVLAQLAACGVPAHPSGVCTLEDEQYFSHRRSQRDGVDEGRFIGFITASAVP
ncbi:polyphenol oxidase family protein [Arthrobacter sp. H35-D1]|uniref:polyphenol oxidase family protein n=1 Tax=Arthrobacter sp. H35-D1 TaxID=3046202 RepID=UPI0024B98031|nr:polyphenol oxidase family protein [Arthrobacter sp. H35-D1]MDJ0313243.1 polyphenol oxidase family protein [Arthrobacter sp. H35-D1]